MKYIMRAMLLVGGSIVTIVCFWTVVAGIAMLGAGFEGANQAAAELKASSDGPGYGQAAATGKVIGSVFAATAAVPLIAVGLVPFWFTWPVVYVLWLAMDRLGPHARTSDATSL